MSNVHSPFEPGYVGNHDGGGVALLDDGPAAADPAVGENGPELLPPSGNDEAGTADVPNGTVEEVLAWVGNDRGRAETALAVEDTRDRPRAGVVTPLTQLLNDEPTPSE